MEKIVKCQIKKTCNNYTTIGFWFNNNDRYSISVTPINFYDIFDELSKFLGIHIEYEKPKIYPTKYDYNKIVILPAWSKFGINQIPKDTYNQLTSNLGYYTKEELCVIWNGMLDFVLNQKQDVIFEQISSDVSNIGFNPYTIYKEIYPNSPIDCYIMFCLCQLGDWYYQTRTLGENINYVHKKYNEDYSNIIQSSLYHSAKNKLTPLDIEKSFRFLDTYRKI